MVFVIGTKSAPTHTSRKRPNQCQSKVLQKLPSRHTQVISGVKSDRQQIKHMRVQCSLASRGNCVLPQSEESCHCDRATARYTQTEPLRTSSEGAGLARWLAWLQRAVNQARKLRAEGRRESTNAHKIVHPLAAIKLRTKIKRELRGLNNKKRVQKSFKTLMTGWTFPRSQRSSRTECKRLPPGPSREPACDGLSLGAAHSGAAEQ